MPASRQISHHKPGPVRCRTTARPVPATAPEARLRLRLSLWPEATVRRPSCPRSNQSLERALRTAL
ncbi:hypothetical protein Micbo1qcDRAFT_166076, partial [Microdochium bolleyi]